MNSQIADGKWKEFKGVVREMWGKLTDDDLEKAKGNMDQIAGKVQSMYGEKLSDAQSKINNIVKKVNKSIP